MRKPCQAIQEMSANERANGFKEGIRLGQIQSRSDTLALCGRIFKYMQANPCATNEAIASACKCSSKDAVIIRISLSD